MLNEDNYRSRKRIKQSRFGSNVSGCLVIFFLTQIQCSSSTNRLARSVPRGYQPPPTSPLVEDVPVMQYKQYKPPSRFSHPSSNNLPSFKHPSVAGEAKEPLMVNTLIQVFGPEKGDETETEKQRLSTFVGETSSEQNSPTPPTELLNGQKRVTLTRQLDTLGRTFVPANQTISTANPKIAIVKAFAASNSSQISEAQLREELGKELEQSVSLILDELGRKDKTTKHPVTSTTQSVPAEELERLEGEEEATTLPKETENSVVSTREATSLQTASTTTVAPLVVFPKTSKEPIEVVPATNVATTAETSEKEKKEEATVGIKEENNDEENEITSTKETLTEENIVEIKSTTIATAQIYKSAEKKNEAETNLPVATTTNIIEESPTTPTIIKQEETKEENKENSEKPTYPTEEEKGGVTLEGSLIFDKKTTTPEEIAFAEDEASITETISEEKKTTLAATLEATTTTIQTTPETLLQTNSENVLSKEQQEVKEEETKEQQKQTTLNVVGNREVPGPGWQRTDFEEGQLWVQCKPPSIRALLWPWPTNRTFENGVLFAKDFHEESDCYAELDKDSGGGEARLDIGPGKCGLAGSKANSSQTPQNLSLVLMFAPRRSLFSFLVQCYTPVLPAQRQQLTADLAIQKPLASPVMTKTIELSQTPPRCEYSLRRNTPDGPLLQRATLGQTIYHRWECEGGQDVAEQFGILLSDCVVANLTQEKTNNNSSSPGKTSMVELIDSEGCSTDPLIVDDPEYEKENLVAYARARVFSLRPESHFLRFSCKLSLCLRQNDGCLGLTPPACPPTNESRIPSHHHSSEKAPTALSQQLLSPQLTVNSDGSTATTSSTPPRLPFHGSAASFGGTGKSSLVDSAWTIGLVLGVSVLLGLFFGLATFLIQSHHRRNRQKRLVQWVLARPPSSSSGSATSSQEVGYIGRRGISIEAIQLHSDDYSPTEAATNTNNKLCSPSSSESGRSNKSNRENNTN
uniref:ZP domain-containing protein n=1 Tax=Meloidogyne enterolobii TaxID=390850 RepID=A0A6V7V4A7_MELEN|nr:unnamed protein product [Meloidogyne enterolobii]